MTERTSVGALLKRYRLAAGLSQEALAARAGLSARAVSDLERGLHRAPRSSTLDLLATALSLSSQQRAMLLAAAHPELEVAVETAPQTPARHLPLPPTSLIGRERELARAMDVLGSHQGRLLTLSGPSGVGKTRLALQIARDLDAAFADSVLFVDLAPTRDASLVPGRIAQALGLRERADVSPAEQVSAYLQDRQLLLVLDNFEHLLEAAPFVADLLAQCPRLAVLVTSRAPLRLRAEQTLPLAPLPVEDAMALFRERAQAVRPDGVFPEAEVAAICERLDCLPLAIELAAVRVGMLSLSQMLEHLTNRLMFLRGGARDLPARQQTMEDAIAWSYELLTEPQQRCFRALGVFVGGWTLDAARAVCAEEKEVSRQEAILSMAALLDAGLIQAEIPTGGPTRFRMLELMREYALERLRVADEEDAYRRRHAIYYARLAEIVVAFGPGQHVAAAPLALESPNVRAALEWTEDRQEAELGLRLVGFCRLWHVGGQIGEAVRWQERMLALDLRVREQGEHAAPLPLRIRCLYGFARTLLGGGHMRRAKALATEALRLAQRIGDQSGMSNAFATLGLIAQANGSLDEAAAAFAEALPHAELADDGDIGTHALVHLAELARIEGDSERSGTLLEEALTRSRGAGAIWDIAIIATMLGQLALQNQHYVQARARFRESLTLFRTLGSPTYSAWCLESLAATLSAEDHHALALRLCAAAVTWRQQANTPLPPAEREAYERTIAAARAALGEQAFGAEWAAGAAHSQETAIAEALDALSAGAQDSGRDRKNKELE
ncbi:MAG TPA: helix-turn-helix domain-containing protein [Ktedonobacterales bacterium]|nr:helix-turn-helix domain-containing protein [Ktedonobacterales bacterium]